MSEILKDRKDNDREYMWDLSSLFSDDDEWEKKLKETDRLKESVSAYQGRLNNEEAIKAYLDTFWNAEMEMNDLYTYAMLRYHEDMRDGNTQSMYSRISSKVISFSEASAFAEPEILSLDEEQLDRLTESEILKDYHYYLENLKRRKKHVLSGGEESILAAMREVTETPMRIAENLMNADLVFDSCTDGEGNERQLSQSDFILTQTSTDRVLRENAFRAFYKTYKEHQNTLAASLTGAVKGLAAEAKIRKYGSDREMSLDSNNIPVSVYDNLIDTVHSRMSSMYRYLKLRKRMLGVDELHYYDLYAPLYQAEEKRYSFAEAEEMVKNAVKPLGAEYGSIVDRAFREHWIDVYPNKGKMGGAYSSGSYHSVPNILLNYMGTLNDVSTTAHEMGHSLHSWYTNHHQPPQYSSYTMFVAEVASTVNENLLAENLLKSVKDPEEKMAVLNLILEGFKGTVFRQTMFAEFEREIHAMEERGEALSAEVFCDLYEKLIREYFGDEIVIDDEVRYEWARIPHFYYLFYVFVYATGYCSAAALSEMILNDGEQAAERYLEFLSMGGSVNPLDELKHAGVDLNTPDPINRAIDKFDRILAEAEKTAEELGL